MSRGYLKIITLMWIPCQNCGQRYDESWPWYVCDTCGYRICSFCFDGIGRKCPQCDFGHFKKK